MEKNNAINSKIQSTAPWIFLMQVISWLKWEFQLCKNTKTMGRGEGNMFPMKHIEPAGY